MKKKLPARVEAVFVPDSEGFWLVEFPQLPGLHTFGETLREAKRNAQEAYDAWIEEHESYGVPVRVR